MAKEEKKKLPKISRRKWLNSGQGTAYVSIEGNIFGGYGRKSDRYSLDATVEIKDCTRQCVLEFYANSEKQLDVRLKKLRLLMSELKALEDFMINNRHHLTKKEAVNETPAKKEEDSGVVHLASALVRPVKVKAKEKEND